MELEMEFWRRLPLELRMLVLSMLPLQLLLSLRRVCKEWNSLQLDPTFARLQRERCRPKEKGGFLGVKQVGNGKLYYVRHDKTKWLELPPLQLHLGRCWFEDASDNLTLWSVLNKHFYVFNPANGKGEELPQCTFSALEWPLCHKLQGCHVDPRTGEYKVVCACLDSRRACLYESARGAWREISAPAVMGISQSIKHVHGKIIWTLSSRILLQFDFESETWVSKEFDGKWMYGSIDNQNGIQLELAEGGKVRVRDGEDISELISCTAQGTHNSVAIQGKRVLIIPHTSSSTCFVHHVRKKLRQELNAPCPLECAQAFNLAL